MTFIETRTRHLNAIRERDFDGLVDTVASDEIVLVTAAGEVSTDAQRFLQLHGEWFKGQRWSLDTEILHVREATDLATCLLKLDYRDEEEGRLVHEQSILSLIFARREGRWVLVQDQNTPVRS